MPALQVSIFSNAIMHVVFKMHTIIDMSTVIPGYT